MCSSYSHIFGLASWDEPIKHKKGYINYELLQFKHMTFSERPVCILFTDQSPVGLLFILEWTGICPNTHLGYNKIEKAEKQEAVLQGTGNECGDMTLHKTKGKETNKKLGAWIFSH